MASRQIKVEKIELLIGGKTLELSPEEVRELRDVLNATFPVGITYPYHQPVVIPQPVYPWPRPWRWEPIWYGGGKNECTSAHNDIGEALRWNGNGTLQLKLQSD